MPKYVCIAAHISIGELENRYRKATDPVERSHFQIIWLLAQGKRVREISEVTGYCANWIRILARRYNQKGQMERVRLDEVGEHCSGLVNGSLLLLSSHSPGRRYGKCVG